MIGMSAVYNFHNNLMLMLHLQSPLIADKGDYPLSYRFIEPLQFTFGYIFYYNKENEKISKKYFFNAVSAKFHIMRKKKFLS